MGALDRAPWVRALSESGCHWRPVRIESQKFDSRASFDQSPGGCVPPLVDHALTVFMAFFAIMNPVANAVIFMGLTSQVGIHTTQMIAWRAIVIAFGIVACFAILGPMVFSLFGITLSALRIAGGVLISLVGYRMLHGEHSRIQHPKSIQSQAGAEVDVNEVARDIAVTPLGIPVLAGPGTIATAMSYAPSGHWLEVAVTLVMFAVICGITYYAFVFSERILVLLGREGVAVITRLMGLILAVIGVQMILVGLKAAGF